MALVYILSVSYSCVGVLYRFWIPMCCKLLFSIYEPFFTTWYNFWWREVLSLSNMSLLFISVYLINLNAVLKVFFFLSWWADFASVQNVTVTTCFSLFKVGVCGWCLIGLASHIGTKIYNCYLVNTCFLPALLKRSEIFDYKCWFILGCPLHGH